MPSLERTTSVFHSVGLSPAEIADAGRRAVRIAHGKECLGWGAFIAKSVPTELEIDYNNDPPRHANLVGWPAEKEGQYDLALVLAAAATLVETSE
jgi:hypothetical protein